MAGDHPHRIVQILDKKSPAPSSITVTAAVAAAFARAAFVNRKREIALSWLSLFIGLLASDDAISLWLREYFKSTGHELQPLLEQHHLALPSFDALRSEGPPLALLIEPLLCGDSVWLLLKKAEFARNQTADPSAAIDVHHIVSGLISVPDDEQTGLPGPSLDVRNSGPAFVSEVTQLYPTEVRFWEQWLSDLTVKSSAERTNATESDNLDAVRRRRAMHDEQPPTSNRSGQPGSSLRLEEVQFTLYSPKVIQPGTWHPLLAFMHLDDRMPFVPRDVPSQIEEVRTRAARSLSDALPGFLDKTSDATQRVPHDSDIVMVPSFEHIEFRPRSCTFTWTGEVHEERFKLKARDHSRGGITNGHFNVYLGGTLLIAQLTMEIRIDESVPAVTERQTSVTVTPYRKIFPSYSRKDDEIVRQFERFQAALGDSYLRDVTHLRAGELWEPAIERLITEADVFQLFWSWNAMRSEQVQREWTYALGLGRPAFVRPTYWEDPLPQAAGLPPEQLRRIHFHRLHWPGMKYSGTDVRVPTDDLAVSYEPPPGGEVDPLELLGPKRPPIPGVPRAGDLAGAPVINEHHFAPVIPEQEPPAHSEAGLIPDDYDPLTADDLSAVRSVPPPALPSPPRSDVVPPKAGDAGATARGRAPSPAAGPAEGAGRHDGSLADVLAGAGLEGVAVTPELSRAFGQIFRVMVEGVMDVLQARQRLRDEFRIGVPTFRPTDNNPLKFSANVEDAVNNLLVKRNAAYLGPFDAFEDAFDDLRHDQMAMLVGMRAAFDAIVAQFEPDRLQEIFDRQLKTGGFVPMPAKMRYWDLYRLRFDEIAKDPDVTFQAFFASVFIKASEEQLERLKNKGRTRRR